MMNLRAHAKINIGLRIRGKRPDGYHDIETVFHRVNPYDEIILESSDKIALICTDPTLPTDERNLCVRAARLLLEYAGDKRGVQIILLKKIPVGAGLGGGSSDAAATLMGLIKLWDLNIDEATLKSLALQLGSDVPYFLREGTAHALGRGELLEYFKLPIPYWIVVIYPNIHISTTEAYKQFENTPSHQEADNVSQLQSHKETIIKHLNDPQLLARYIQNDFEPIILHQNETIRFCKISLYAAGAKFAQMSGSGSSLYGFFTDQATAFGAAEQFGKKYKVFITPPNR